MRTTVVIVLILLLASSARAGCATVSITGAATAVFAANDFGTGVNRVFSIQNNNPGGADVWCAKTGTPAVNSGIYLAKGGGMWVDGPLPAEAISCITAGATTTVYACDYPR